MVVVNIAIPPHKRFAPSSRTLPNQVNSRPPLPAISFLLFLNVLLIEMRDMREVVQTFLASLVQTHRGPETALSRLQVLMARRTPSKRQSRPYIEANASAVEEAGKFEVTGKWRGGQPDLLARAATSA
jgi:hypothetical protein